MFWVHNELFALCPAIRLVVMIDPAQHIDGRPGRVRLEVEPLLIPLQTRAPYMRVLCCGTWRDTRKTPHRGRRPRRPRDGRAATSGIRTIINLSVVPVTPGKQEPSSPARSIGSSTESERHDRGAERT